MIPSGTKKSCSSDSETVKSEFVTRDFRSPAAWDRRPCVVFSFHSFTAVHLADPSAAENAIAVVENGSLSRGNGALRRVENHAYTGRIERFQACVGRDMLVADLNQGVNGPAEIFERDPVYALDFASGGAQGFIIAHHDPLGLVINGDNVEWLARGESQAFALTDGELMYATVPADDGTYFVDNLASAV